MPDSLPHAAVRSAPGAARAEGRRQRPARLAHARAAVVRTARGRVRAGQQGDLAAQAAAVAQVAAPQPAVLLVEMTAQAPGVVHARTVRLPDPAVQVRCFTGGMSEEPPVEVVDGELVQDDGARLDAALSAVADRVRDLVVADVQRLRARQPGLADQDLARLVVRRGTRRVAWASAATGFGGLATAAVHLPSVLALQAALVLAVAEVYGELDDPDLTWHVALVLGGDRAVGAVRASGVPAADDVSRRWITGHVTRETMRQVRGVVARAVLTTAGRRSLSSVTKLVPVVGAGVGYVLDRAAAQQLGERAIRYYGR